jgi:hypothetical protein
MEQSMNPRFEPQRARIRELAAEFDRMVLEYGCFPDLNWCNPELAERATGGFNPRMDAIKLAEQTRIARRRAFNDLHCTDDPTKPENRAALLGRLRAFIHRQMASPDLLGTGFGFEVHPDTIHKYI